MVKFLRPALTVGIAEYSIEIKTDFFSQRNLLKLLKTAALIYFKMLAFNFCVFPDLMEE